LALRDQVIRVAIVALLTVNMYYAAIEPCTSAEAVVYQRYASHDLLDLWKSPLDLRLGLVYGVLARFATRLGGVSELTVRIPAILGGLLFWIGLAAFCRRLSGWSSVLVFLAVAANPWSFRAFSAASGTGLAIGLLACAVLLARRNVTMASVLTGLAVGSDALVAIPAMAAGSIAAAFMTSSLWRWVDELMLPGLLAGMFLLLPALLIRERPAYAARDDWGTRGLIQSLRDQHHSAGLVRIAAVSPLEPGLFFYRRRYHLDWLQIVPNSEVADYYLLSRPGDPLIAQRGLRVLEDRSGSLLAAH
jgi:hypothetical protein